MVSPSCADTHRQTKAHSTSAAGTQAAAHGCAAGSHPHEGRAGTRTKCMPAQPSGQPAGTAVSMRSSLCSRQTTAQRPPCSPPRPLSKNPTFMPARCCVIFPPSGNSGWLPAQYTCSTTMGHKPWIHTSTHVLLLGNKCVNASGLCARALDSLRLPQNPESYLDQKVQLTQVSVTRDGCVGPHHTLPIDV